MKIIIGISGGIAAYKSCELVRLLQKAGHEVRAIMTEGAKQFIHLNTFAALTKDHAYDSVFSQKHNAMLHIELAKWADLIIVAPATANIISKLSYGTGDDLLTTVCLATNAACYIAPAMNCQMWNKPATQRNIKQLSSDGYHVLPTEEGEQACGDIGFGRMLEPEKIMQHVLLRSNKLKGTTVIITAGPTIEKLDPVRYLSNFSSGKMGYALASAYCAQGATVHLISGPTQLNPPADCIIHPVTTAKEMLETVKDKIINADIFIAAAAVADYTPLFHEQKIKKSDEHLTLKLEKTIDILSHVTTHHPETFSVGFCAETNDLIDNAKKKLKAKKCNVIIANQIQQDGYPFNCDSNKLHFITKEKMIALPENSKTALAYLLADEIMAELTLLF
jgi:phosphopantothenoylcysteine decarboxylase / phosphopantothenate---cysteine ligase